MIYRDKPANDVHVTGTFDDWKKTVQLDKNGDLFEKTVDLPNTSEKIYYKFVVDGEWVTSDAKSEPDASGNVNNFLNPEDLTSTNSSSTHPTISSVAPGAS